MLKKKWARKIKEENRKRRPLQNLPPRLTIEPKQQSPSFSWQPFNIRVFHLSIIGSITFGFFMVVPAFIFAKLEPGWNFLDSLYYCFISLTTIGLGDYIPGDAPNQPMRALYKVCITGTRGCNSGALPRVLLYCSVHVVLFGICFLLYAC